MLGRWWQASRERVLKALKCGAWDAYGYLAWISYVAEIDLEVKAASMAIQGRFARNHPTRDE
jgi:hypothetical protein